MYVYLINIEGVFESLGFFNVKIKFFFFLKLRRIDSYK